MIQDEAMLYSKFKDYYDFAIPSAFVDVHWERHLEKVTIELTKGEIDSLFEMARHGVETMERCKRGVVYSQNFFSCLGFCGKLYPYWTLDSSLLFWHEAPWKGTIETQFFPIPKAQWESFGINKAPNLSYHESPLIDKIHKTIDSPVFSFYGKGARGKFIEIVKNPCLSIYGFQDVMPSTQASQELMMYLPRLKEDPEPLPITDGLRAKMAGHGKKSFSQGTPGAKKEKRRLNRQRKRLAKQ